MGVNSYAHRTTTVTKRCVFETGRAKLADSVTRSAVTFCGYANPIGVELVIVVFVVDHTNRIDSWCDAVKIAARLVVCDLAARRLECLLGIDGETIPRRWVDRAIHRALIALQAKNLDLNLIGPWHSFWRVCKRRADCAQGRKYYRDTDKSAQE